VNLILLFEQDFITSDRVKLSDERFKHIRSIHQSSLGDSVRVGLLNGLMGQGIIEKLDKDSVEISVALDQPAPKKLPLTVILALPRPKMIRRIFRSITELGVEELIIINSYKVEKSFWQSPVLEDNKVRDYLITGLQQAKDTQLPKVSFHKRFKPFVEDVLPTLMENKRGFVAHPNTGQSCPHSLNSPLLLAIGPEGGFTDYEVGKFVEAGFEGIHLGERILRVENAITALTSKLYD
jgi:16S rRNA (uracil1498-N3)-methyltransferase